MVDEKMSKHNVYRWKKQPVQPKKTSDFFLKKGKEKKGECKKSSLAKGNLSITKEKKCVKTNKKPQKINVRQT